MSAMIPVYSTSQDGPLPSSPMKGEVLRGGSFDDLPTNALFTSPFMGEDGRGPSRYGVPRTSRLKPTPHLAPLRRFATSCATSPARGEVGVVEHATTKTNNHNGGDYQCLSDCF